MWTWGTVQPITTSQLTEEKDAWKSQLKSRNWWEAGQTKNPGTLIPGRVLPSVITTSSGVGDRRGPGCCPRNGWWEQSHLHPRDRVSARGLAWSQLPAATEPIVFPSSSNNLAGLHQ